VGDITSSLRNHGVGDAEKGFGIGDICVANSVRATHRGVKQGRKFFFLVVYVSREAVLCDCPLAQRRTSFLISSLQIVYGLNLVADSRLLVLYLWAQNFGHAFNFISYCPHAFCVPAHMPQSLIYLDMASQVTSNATLARVHGILLTLITVH
jgi:hypothetical protein